MASGGLAEGITDGSGGGGGGVEMQSRNDTGMESSPSSHSVFVIADSSSSSPMEIDPIDDGPRINVLASAATNAKYMPPVPTYGSSLAHQQQQLIPNSNSGIATEDEARQCIELLRSDDVSGRVSAANRLDALALALGTDRTRNVRIMYAYNLSSSSL